MVERQLAGRGIEDERVLEAMASITRESFVPEALRPRAYEDSALPLGEDQTISQPWIVAAICQALALDGSEVVLEVGTGSGYSACVLARLAARVITIERRPLLAERALQAIERLAQPDVQVLVGDGSLGLPERAPFEAIAVHATAPAPPPALLGQLADGGRMVVPIAAEGADLLTVFVRDGKAVRGANIGPCRFVPLVGEGGFAP